jgi:hypothetical protein
MSEVTVATPVAKSSAKGPKLVKNKGKNKGKPKAAPKKAEELKIPEPVATSSRGRTVHMYTYSGKSEAETKPRTPQMVGMIHGMQEKGTDETFDLYTLVDYCVLEGHISMPHTKDPTKQKKRIVACYKKRLEDEGFINKQ